ncbi:MAG: preprotein translocase subunit YajC [Clostridia bacterium]|nr:preprotein translocase subunit YajC [Clostridia bacterium]
METLVSLFPLILMVLIFYFILIRPQKKKEKQLRDMLAALKVGDEVASIGGIHGKISRIKEDVFVLETGVGTTKSFITIERNAISRLLKAATTANEEVAPLPDEEIETTEE